MAATPHDSATLFTFSGNTFTITSLTYNLTDAATGDQIDISHLGLTTGNSLLFQDRPLKGATGGETGKEISIDYIGTSQLAGGTSAAFSLSGPLTLSGTATVVSSSLSLTLNDVIRGSATFRIKT